MEEREFLHFSAALSTVAEAFRVKLSPARARLYFGQLCDLPYPAVGKALDQCLRQCERFPTIAKLRSLVFLTRGAHGSGGTYPPDVAAQRRRHGLPVTEAEQAAYDTALPTPATAHGREALVLCAEIIATRMPPAARLARFQALAARYPGLGWEEAVRETEALL